MNPENRSAERIDTPENVAKVAELLQGFGADPERADVMASQLIKRARQKASTNDVTEIEALSELIAEIARIKTQG